MIKILKKVVDMKACAIDNNDTMSRIYENTRAFNEFLKAANIWQLAFYLMKMTTHLIVFIVGYE